LGYGQPARDLLDALVTGRRLSARSARYLWISRAGHLEAASPLEKADLPDR
jgi:hypothetical protein